MSTSTPASTDKKKKTKPAPAAGESTHTFTVNGKKVSVTCANDVRVLWVLRDLLGVTGPKYGCGLDVCRACTSFLNGDSFNPCSVPISAIKSTDEITTIEGLASSVHRSLHPMQQAWIDYDVAQCGYCQPGQIMNAIALVEQVHAEGREPNDSDFDQIRNICRCGTYFRIRQAIVAGAKEMHNLPHHQKRVAHKKKHKATHHKSTAHHAAD